MRILHELTKKLSGEGNLDVTLGLCLDTAIEISGMDSGAIYIVDDEGGVILSYTSGLSQKFTVEGEFYEAESDNARIVNAGVPLFLKSDELEPLLNDSQHEEGLTTLGIVPVKNEGRVIACINVSSHSANDIIPSVRETLGTLTAQVGSIIDRTRAQEELRDREELLRHVNVELDNRNRELQKLIVELENRNEEMERFIYSVSHDLKSPLITIAGYLGFLKEDFAEGNIERLNKDISRISSAASKMRQLLDELLELSRVGRLDNPYIDVTFADLANEAVELVAGQISATGVNVKITPDLPSVYGDRQRLLEVVQNLVDNAVKFMGNQTKPEVEIGVRREDGENVFYIKDNGTGIDPKYQDRVFGLFDQLNPGIEGSGIGLALVKRIIETHGGLIWVESEGLGKGTTFCFTLSEKNN